MKGLVFNIQRFSVHDGPGIRTTVFLKGCPLRCKWCHNPESISAEPELILRKDRCIRCGDCYAFCKNHAVQHVDDGFETLRDVCIDCGECVEICSAEARGLAGKEMTTEEVIAEIEKDIVFYDQSGGGASFSGGEPLLQHDFLVSLLVACKRKNIHTVVDTAGVTTSAIIEKVSAHVDLFLFDLKTLDDERHKEFAGASNVQILNNLRRLSELKKQVVVRIPVIPGFNDTYDNVRGIGAFVAELGNVREIHLLPYHPTGTEKYVRLGKEYQMESTVPPSADDLSLYVKALRQYVPDVSIGG
jgi:pyruvate formate lyase activating enzyme